MSQSREKHVCKHAHFSSTADIWTKIAAVGEGTAGFISDAYWIGELIDLVAMLEDAGYGLSWWGLGFGTGIACITALGAAYSHTMLNIAHQPKHDHDHNEHEHEHHELINEDSHDDTPKSPALSFMQWAALGGDFISHTGEIAGPITFIANIAAKERLPFWAKATIQGGATLFGAVSSIANVRTCKQSMQELNEVRPKNCVGL